MRESKITYYPTLSVKENARKNGVSEAAIRYYIKTNNLDRRFERKLNIIAECRKYIKKHPKATKTDLHNKLGYAVSTIREYWEYITTEKELSNFDSNKSNNHQLRQVNDFYATHPSCTSDILREEVFHENILEPFCGVGSMSKVIEEHGYRVLSYDIIDRGYGKVGDFFKVDYPKDKYDIITNPPYSDNLVEIIIRCLKLCKNKVAILMPLRYLSSEARYSGIYKKFPPSRVYVYQERICIAKNADFDTYNDAGANMEIYAWYIWEKGHNGTTELKWISNKRKKKKVENTQRYENVTILDNIPFNPFEEFNIHVKDCIEFHSKALPENRVLSNHYDCIIRFRDCEFYSVEQLFLGLTYSDSPHILKEIMLAKDGITAKKICRKKYENKRDWDFEEKRYRIIALCHLYKYLSVKEYRDRLRETYPQILVECPNGSDYEFGLVQNLDTNIFEGNNCSGRTTMIIRDMMLQLENCAISKREAELGRELNNDEREAIVEVVCNDIRAKFDADKRIIRDSKSLFAFIEKNNIPKIKIRRPEPMQAPVIDRKSKGLVVDFDYTLFDTSAGFGKYERRGEDGLQEAIEQIPNYTLYDGWREVIDWCIANNIKIGILSGAKKKLIEATLEYYNIPYNGIVGFKLFMRKPNPILANQLLEMLNIREEQIVYIGNSKLDEIQARCSKFRFYGSTWHNPEENYFENNGVPTISNPREIIEILKNMD